MIASTMIQDQIALEKLQKFLQLNQLPHTDIKLQGNLFIGYHDEEGKLIGSGGLELYGDAALLRSVAVDETLRGKSLGKKIVEDLVEKARGLQVNNIYLLTETAHDFFIKKGFNDVSREEVPEAVRNSTEFSQLCPASASCMIFKIQ
jgi:amino-acid N-acetyltransferase